MFRRASERYVVLQDTVPLLEQRAIERAVIEVLPPVQPSQAFVTQLSRDLVAEARRRQIAHPEKADRVLQILGFLSGGIFSMLGGIVIWLLIQRSHDQRGTKLHLSSAQQPTASTGSA